MCFNLAMYIEKILASDKLNTNPYYIKENHKKYSQNNINKRNSYELPVAYNINFKQKLNYHDFLINIYKVHKNKSIKNVILSAIKDKNNFIGAGFNADVYSIPGVENYLIRIVRKDFDPKSIIENEMIPEPQNELAPNFGQYIATNNRGLYITKKVFGESNSFPDWSNVITNLENGANLTPKDAEFMFNKIRVLSNFPQKSFDDLAKNIQDLNKYTDCEIDIINPNNLIVDNKKKTISIIDLWYQHSENGSKAPFNGVDSMINLMLDPLTYNYVYKLLDKKQQEQFIKFSQEIIQKNFIAAKKFNLQRNKENAKIIYSDLDKHSNFNFALPAYNKFLRFHYLFL